MEEANKNRLSASGTLLDMRIDKSFTDIGLIALLIGALMPVISGLAYPTYYHRMNIPWVEWTRLMEAPFLFCELLILRLAIHRGLDLNSAIRGLPKDIKIASAFLVVGIFAGSLFFSQNMPQSLAHSLAYVIHILFAFAVYHLAKGSDNQEGVGKNALSIFPQWIGIGLIILAIYTAWRFAFPIAASEVPGGEIEWGAALPGFISVRHFGSWAGAAVAMFAAILMFRDRKSFFGWADLFFLFAVTMTFWSGTRGAIAGVGIAMFVMLISLRRFPSFAVVLRFAILTIFAAILAVILLPENEPQFSLFAAPDMTGQSSGEVVVSLGTGRIEMWALTYQEWLKSPLFGWGSGSTFWQLNQAWTHTQPHNVLMQYLISWGLVGTLGALWLLGRAVVAAHKVTMAQVQYWPFMACAYCLLAMSLQEGMLHYPRFIMLTFAMLAIIIAQNGKSADQNAALT